MDIESLRKTNFELIKSRISYISNLLDIEETEIISLLPHLSSDNGYE